MNNPLLYLAIIFGISSGISCKKFEAFFGSYLRQELTATFSDSTSRQMFGQILPAALQATRKVFEILKRVR